MGQVHLNGMEFYAYHGCYEQEQLIGNRFLIDLVLEYSMDKASKDDLIADALNYAEVYELVKQEMGIRSHLLEHLSARILDRLFTQFLQLEWAEIRIAKLNPPLNGQLKSVSVVQQKSR